jgi:hypothetical protein
MVATSGDKKKKELVCPPANAKVGTVLGGLRTFSSTSWL